MIIAMIAALVRSGTASRVSYIGISFRRPRPIPARRTPSGPVASVPATSPCTKSLRMLYQTRDKSYGHADPRSPEPVAAREAARDRAAGAAARALPRHEIDLGADAVLALPPGEAVGEAEHLAVGETAGAVALQDDAAAARHRRNFREIDDQQAAVLADQRGGVALGRDTGAGDGALARHQDLLAGAGLRQRLFPGDDKAAPVAGGDEIVETRPIGE